ncbi:MAG: V-type ATPase 116kDa subunit family protein [Clostridia bacterium]
MSIVRMRKLTLIGLTSDKDKLLRALSRLRALDVKVADELKNTSAFEQDKDKINENFSRVSNALALADKIKKDAKAINIYSQNNIKQFQKAVKKGGEDLAELTTPLVYANTTDAKALEVFVATKKPKFQEPKIFTFDDLDEIFRNRARIEGYIADIENASKRIDSIKTELSKLSLLRNQMLVYRSIDAPFSQFADHKYMSCIVGAMQKSKLNELALALKEVDLCELFRFDDVFSEAAFAIIFHKEVASEINGVLNNFVYTKCPFEYSRATIECIEEINCGMAKLGQECKNVAFENAEQGDKLKDIQTLFDYYNLELRKLEAAEKCRATTKTFLLEGWIPFDKESLVSEKLSDKDCVVAFEFADPQDNELPPTLTKNNGFVSAFEGVTNMYGVPNYRERDPNTLLAIFYFLLFGIMLGDAGYGIFVTLSCFIYLALAKKTKKKSPMIKMFLFCGISTIVWGVLFGGWFAIENIGALESLRWFNPLNEPLKMFVLSLCMGALQEMVAFFVGGITKAENEKSIPKKIGLMLSNFGWCAVMIAFFLVLPAMMKILGITTETVGWQATMVSVGGYVAIVGVAMLVLGGVVGKTNPLKMFTGIFGNLYGGINVISDLLSYTRLFGLGLTSAVIGYVINILVGIFVQMLGWAGWIIAVPVLIIGHGFNIGINMLGAYVHNARLQFIEFFGHFYDGSGYLYKPLGAEMKYTFVETASENAK